VDDVPPVDVVRRGVREDLLQGVLDVVAHGHVSGIESIGGMDAEGRARIRDARV
jgi:hypothetical protein